MLHRRALTAALALPFLARGAAAQGGYPSGPVRLIVPFAAGGTADIFARIVAEHLRVALGKPVVVENVGGAGSTIGIAQLARAQPDGQTLCLASTGGLAIAPALNRGVPYKPEELAAVGQISVVPNVLAVNPGKIRARDVPGLIEHLKANPGKVAYGSAGVGTSQHLAAELFQMMTGTAMVHVPYRGSSQMLPDLLSGAVELAFDNVPLILPHAREGRLALLATATAGRAGFDPAVPAVAEYLPGFEATAWHGIVAPARTPRPIVEVLAREIGALMRQPATGARFQDLGAVAVATGPDEFAAHIAAEARRWRTVIEARNIRPEG